MENTGYDYECGNPKCSYMFWSPDLLARCPKCKSSSLKIEKLINEKEDWNTAHTESFA